MANSKLEKIKSQTPVSIIIHGGNRCGYLIAKTLIDQGCHVIVVDNYNSQTSKYISELKSSPLFDFFEFKGLEGIYKNIKRFDYLFYLVNVPSAQGDFDSKEFIKESSYLETSLKNAHKYNAKFALITSLAVNRELSNRVNNIKMASPSPYSDMELQKYCETLSAEFRDKTNLNIRILRLGTLIGKGITSIDSEIIHNLVKDATQKPQITIKGEGLDIHNLIDEKDAVYGILKLTFLDKTKGEVITLANRNDYTTLSIAYKLLELNTEAQSIKFVDNPDKNLIVQDLYVPAPHASKFGWTQQVTLEESLIDQVQTYYDDTNKTWNVAKETKVKKTEIIKTSRTQLGLFFEKLTTPFKKIFTKKEEETKETDWKHVGKLSLVTIAIIVATYFLVYPLIGTAIGLVLINNDVKGLQTSISNIDSTESKTKITRIGDNLDRVSVSISNLSWAFKLVGKENLYKNISQLILGAKYATDGGEYIIDSLAPLSEYIKDFQPAVDFQNSTPTTTREYTQYLNEIKDNSYKVDEAAYKVSLANQIINTIDINTFPAFSRDKISNIRDLVNQVSEGTSIFKDIVVFLPDLLGVNQRERYLILLQNESELRGTGGWLTSYGIVGIEGGQIRELFVDDIYNADGTLKVQGKTFPASTSIQQALGLTTQPFSLVNWDPDLSETEITAQPYIQALGKGNDLDGVITINISFIQKLLDKWGGIEVPGETELITSNNLYSKIFEMHEDFTPGSTTKQTFLANLANQIITKLLSMNITDLISMGSVFEDALNQKDLQATFKNPDAYNFFNDRSWAGSLDSRYNSAPLAIDWNWGGNKANLYLNKNYDLSINIEDENTIDFTYTISAENTSTSTTYPQGNYVNYQRIYIPSNAVVLSTLGFQDGQYNTYKESGFKILGGWFNIPIQSVNTLTVTYQIKRDSSTNNFPIQLNDKNISFDLNLFKQSGEGSHAYKLDISYPSNWNLESSGNLNSIGHQLSSRFEFNKDLTFDISWNMDN